MNSCDKLATLYGHKPADRDIRARANVRESVFIRRTRERKVAEEKPKVTNEISDETGQHDARFLLWRRFCSDNGIPVETMPGDLSGDAKQKWEKLKANLLPKSMNK